MLSVRYDSCQVEVNLPEVTFFALISAKLDSSRLIQVHKGHIGSP